MYNHRPMTALSLRSRIAVTAAAAIAALGVFSPAHQIITGDELAQLRSGRPDPATSTIDRYRKLADYIRDEPAIGYATDGPIDGHRMREQRLAIALYVFAPTLIDPAVRHPIVFANFDDPAACDRFLRDTGYQRWVGLSPQTVFCRKPAP